MKDDGECGGKDSDGGGGVDSDEGGEWLILSYLMDFEDKKTYEHTFPSTLLCPQ